ncbi:MAG: LysM peptidoglycan-binding domain-containing protein [Treponema sp.]|jgi:LysM repeat protein|nr:LysM peptidoglycan-binding domain-containing protein [Treponema sp.]
MKWVLLSVVTVLNMLILSCVSRIPETELSGSPVAPGITEKTGTSGSVGEAAASERAKKPVAPLSLGQPKTESPKLVQTKPAEAPAPRGSGLILEGAQTYRVVRGDTLSRIAKRYYGNANGYYFPLIMLASQNTVRDPDIIVPGMDLAIPDLRKNLADPGANEQLKTFFFVLADDYEKKGKTVIQQQLLQIAQSL